MSREVIWLGKCIVSRRLPGDYVSGPMGLTANTTLVSVSRNSFFETMEGSLICTRWKLRI